MFFSVVVPTYNRLPILRQCLAALEAQELSTAPGVEGYEVIVVDDGSTDETVAALRQAAAPHLRLLQQDHGGAAMARNLGVKAARGNVIVFIDSDLVVVKSFLAAHARALQRHWRRHGNRLCFTYGAVINTSNFAQPTAEPYKLTDLSWAYFATGNVAIDRQLLLRSGLFDPRFCQYGWEDLELGERLRQLGVVLVRCPEAIGYHWHPPFRLQQVPQLVQQEKERARMALVFYRKHPHPPGTHDHSVHLAPSPSLAGAHVGWTAQCPHHGSVAGRVGALGTAWLGAGTAAAAPEPHLRADHLCGIAAAAGPTAILIREPRKLGNPFCRTLSHHEKVSPGEGLPRPEDFSR